MTDNTRQIIGKMQASFPHIYNIYDKSTILYGLLSAFGERYGARTDIIDRLYAMIGIDSTYDEDLEHRWGSLLGISKQIGESYDDYRSRLSIVYSSLSGGTAEAIKYAIASAARIGSNTDIINDYVHVYDAWKYPYEIDPSLLGIDEVVDETSLYGSIICTVDLAGIDGTVDHIKINDAINQTKASGINPYLLFLYNVDEPASLLRNNNTLHDMVTYVTQENASLYNTTINGDSLFGNAILGQAIFGMTSNNVSEDNYYDYMEQSSDELCYITGGDTDNHNNIAIQVQESVSMSTTDASGNKVNIVQLLDESTVVDADSVDFDKITSQIQESASIDMSPNIWSTFGTNSAILNKSFATNIYTESDEHTDTIVYSAVLGRAILGHSILGVAIN